MFVGPVVLNGRFPNKRYYNHFCELIRLISLCLKFELSKEDISRIRDGFIHWVKKYEECASVSFYLPMSTLADRNIGTIISTDQFGSRA